jgi:hypothetical protein
MQSRPANTREIEFLDWLKELKFLPYQQALEDEGYEDLESLALLTKEQIEELSATIKMRPGHKFKFPVAIQTAREELEKRKKQKQEQENEEQEEKANKRERKKQEQEKEQALAQELASIERARKLFKAKARQLKVEDSKGPEDQTAESSKSDTVQKRSTELPEWKDYAAFISHKKMHTEFGDSSETLSIRLKVTPSLVLPL